jgi:uncharacterized protein (TIGR03118 family)
MRLRTSLVALLLIGLLASSAVQAASLGYFQSNLVSDIPGVAKTTDPNLANPWGIAFSPSTPSVPGSPFWIADNHTGLSTLYGTAGNIIPLVVSIPPPAGGTPPAAPTGAVFNGGSSFKGDRFIFATEDGTVAGWQGGTSALLRADESASSAVYKGIAIANNGSSDFVYATNFFGGKIDVFDSNYNSVTLAGNFTDPNLPAGFAPFGIRNFGGQLYVTYAMQDAAKHDDVAGQGNGFVDIFDANGGLVRRLVTGDPVNHTGPMNSPWGMAMAPAHFGQFSNDLLIGNFGDGEINAFDPVTGFFLGTISGANTNPLVNQGLWGLTFGNGGNGGNTNTLYFTAGIPGGGAVEDHGLFGSVSPVPEPATSLLICVGLLPLALVRRLRR